MEKKEATARLENWAYIPQLNYFVGNIFDDKKGRFTDGVYIHTSTIVPFDGLHIGYEFKEGDVIETKNSTYLLGKPYKREESKT